ncbi:MAG: RNA polymerase sigma-70 factor [Bacteroides sp.]|nr:RNA polymerase sigma-70 factor [Roseburia sp.]MCM1346561.1 RNA polymerase sigma-70 factor [Bacteroides sp.]MCM1420561.1 RNA polymerase sigma-70 factor [Bacteroides sp.]
MKVISIHLEKADVFKRYYLELYSQITYFISKYIEDKETAADIIQDVWLRMWEQKMTFPDETAMKAYLYRSIHNAAMNFIRSNSREQQRYEAIKTISDDIDSSNVLNDIVESEIYAIINKAFSELSDASRRVYVESLKGKSQKEIAEELNISVNTVKKHIYNANQYLRKRLEHLFLLILLFSLK